MQKNVKKMTLNYSPNFDHKKRDKKKIKYLIYHYNVSCHYYITKSGKLIQMVPDLYIAWHAGESYWGNDKSINYNSIGIEISNPGHGNGYRNFSDKQIKCLIRISKLIIKKYNIGKNKILGHSDIAPLRKIDPGEKFPWKFLNKKKIGVWHNVSSKKLKSSRKKNSEENLSQFINYLKKIGYNIEYSNLNELKKIIKVFQMRFRPELVNGKLDLECFNIVKSLNNIK